MAGLWLFYLLKTGIKKLQLCSQAANYAQYELYLCAAKGRYPELKSTFSRKGK